jgi:hypothetical protein
MNILTEKNETFSMAMVDRIKREPVHFAIYDARPDMEDFFFPPLTMFENYNSPAIEIAVGAYHIMVPLDFHVVAADPDTQYLEPVPVEEIQNRGFTTLTFNPIPRPSGVFKDPKSLPPPESIPYHLLSEEEKSRVVSPSPRLEEIYQVRSFSEVRWCVPRLSDQQVLVAPLREGRAPPCIFLVHELIGRRIKRFQISFDEIPEKQPRRSLSHRRAPSQRLRKF